MYVIPLYAGISVVKILGICAIMTSVTCKGPYLVATTCQVNMLYN